MLCERALTRYAHGSLLAEKQTVQNWIADSAAQMQAARLMTLHAAWRMDTEGASAARQEIALIKFFGAGVLHDVVDRALQAHGALGYSTDLPLEAMYRFARAARIYDGPDEVHRQSRRAADPARLRGARRRRAERARPDAPRGRARALRRPARGGDLERLSGGRWRSPALGAALARRWRSPPCSRSRRRHGRRRRRRARRPRRAVDRFDVGPRVGRAASARSSSGRARRARAKLRASWPRGCGARCRAAASSACRAAGLRNVVGRLPGTASPRSSSPPTTTRRSCPGFVGANDGAARHRGGARARPRAAADRAPGGRAARCASCSSTARRRPTTAGRSTATGLRGSKAYAKRHADELGALILLDFVADEGPAHPARGELGPRRCGPAAGRRAAGRRRRRVPAPGPATAITDDHTPFLARGVPAIDLIQWPYDCWHQRCDDLPARQRALARPVAARRCCSSFVH